MEYARRTSARLYDVDVETRGPLKPTARERQATTSCWMCKPPPAPVAAVTTFTRREESTEPPSVSSQDPKSSRAVVQQSTIQHYPARNQRLTGFAQLPVCSILPYRAVGFGHNLGTISPTPSASSTPETRGGHGGARRQSNPNETVLGVPSLVQVLL